MAENNITSWVINGLLVFLLLLGLLSSYILLVNNEDRGEMFDNYPEIESYNLNLTSQVSGGRLNEVANINSNLSADYNPELAISAADKSGNAIAINYQDIIALLWASLSVIGVLLFGNVYIAVLSTIVTSIVAYITIAYTIKFIRSGQ